MIDLIGFNTAQIGIQSWSYSLCNSLTGIFYNPPPSSPTKYFGCKNWSDISVTYLFHSISIMGDSGSDLISDPLGYIFIGGKQTVHFYHVQMILSIFYIFLFI
jgi:hypothetical protein